MLLIVARRVRHHYTEISKNNINKTLALMGVTGLLPIHLEGNKVVLRCTNGQLCQVRNC